MKNEMRTVAVQNFHIAIIEMCKKWMWGGEMNWEVSLLEQISCLVLAKICVVYANTRGLGVMQEAN